MYLIHHAENGGLAKVTEFIFSRSLCRLNSNLKCTKGTKQFICELQLSCLILYKAYYR